MTSLDLPSEHPLPADSQVDAEGAGMHSGEEEDYEQSAAAALLGMATALPMYRSLSQNSPGSFKRELDDPRQLLSDSRGSSSDDLSSIYSNGGGGVKRQRSETKDHGGAHTPFPAPRPARVSASCPRLLSSTTTEHPPPRPPNNLRESALPPAFGANPNLSHALTLTRRAAARHMPVPVQVSSMHEDARRSWLKTASALR